jgi:hypothetical protein
VVSASTTHLLHAFGAGGVGVELLELDSRQGVLDLLRRGGAGDRAQAHAVLDVLQPGDAGLGLDEEPLVGDHVGAGEVDGGEASGVDGVRGGDHVDLAVVDQRLALCRRGFAPLHVGDVPPVLVGDVGDHVARHVDVHADEILLGGAFAQSGLVVLGAQDDTAVLDVRQQGPCLGVAAGRQADGAGGDDDGGGDAAEQSCVVIHGVTFSR